MPARYHIAFALSAMVAVIAMPAMSKPEISHGPDMLVKAGRWILVDSPTHSSENGKALEPQELAEKRNEQIICLGADKAYRIYDLVAFIVDPQAAHIERSAFQNGAIETTINLGDAHVNVTAQLSGTYDAAKFDIAVHASGHSHDKPIAAEGVFTGRHVGACEEERGIPKYDSNGIVVEN
jgi:hypothetical protein